MALPSFCAVSRLGSCNRPCQPLLIRATFRRQAQYLEEFGREMCDLRKGVDEPWGQPGTSFDLAEILFQALEQPYKGAPFFLWIQWPHSCAHDIIQCNFVPKLITS